MRKLVFTEIALADLDALFWIIADDSPTRARSYITKIQDACELLRPSPFMGVPRDDIRQGLRTMPLWRRVVVGYEVTDIQIDVLGVFWGGQDYVAILRRGR